MALAYSSCSSSYKSTCRKGQRAISCRHSGGHVHRGSPPLASPGRGAVASKQCSRLFDTSITCRSSHVTLDTVWQTHINVVWWPTFLFRILASSPALTSASMTSSQDNILFRAFQQLLFVLLGWNKSVKPLKSKPFCFTYNLLTCWRQTGFTKNRQLGLSH